MKDLYPHWGHCVVCKKRADLNNKLVCKNCVLDFKLQEAFHLERLAKMRFYEVGFFAGASTPGLKRIYENRNNK